MQKLINLFKDKTANCQLLTATASRQKEKALGFRL